MSCVPYASVLGDIMYAMICIRPDIPHVIVVSLYQEETLGDLEMDSKVSEWDKRCYVEFGEEMVF